MSASLRQHVPVGLVYADDAGRRDPPEAEPGAMPLVGYRGLDVEQLPRGHYEFGLGLPPSQLSAG